MKLEEERKRRIVADIIAHGESIERIVEMGRPAFFDPRDDRNRIYVEHRLESIADAASALGRRFQKGNPSVDWDRLWQFRKDISHPYKEESRPVSVDEIWQFAVNEVPHIVRHLRRAKFPK